MGIGSLTPITLKDLVINFFVSLFDRSPCEESASVHTHTGINRVTHREIVRLTKRATMEEVRKVVSDMKKFGSSSLDGVPVVFYQNYWEAIGTSITSLVNIALTIKRIPKQLLSAYISLIPKKERPENAGDF